MLHLHHCSFQVILLVQCAFDFHQLSMFHLTWRVVCAQQLYDGWPCSSLRRCSLAEEAGIPPAKLKFIGRISSATIHSSWLCCQRCLSLGPNQPQIRLHWILENSTSLFDIGFESVHFCRREHNWCLPSSFAENAVGSSLFMIPKTRLRCLCRLPSVVHSKSPAWWLSALQTWPGLDHLIILQRAFFLAEDRTFASQLLRVF